MVRRSAQGLGTAFLYPAGRPSCISDVAASSAAQTGILNPFFSDRDFYAFENHLAGCANRPLVPNPCRPFSRWQFLVGRPPNERSTQSRFHRLAASPRPGTSRRLMRRKSICRWVPAFECAEIILRPRSHSVIQLMGVAAWAMSPWPQYLGCTVSRCTVSLTQLPCIGGI